MRWMDGLAVRLRSLLKRERIEQEMDAELRFHLDQQIEQHLAAGMRIEEARSSALRLLGSVAHSKDQCRDSLGLRLVDDVRRDLRYALRQLRKNPGFSAVAIAMLALGIGASSTVFTIANGMTLRGLPVPNPDRIIVFNNAAGAPLPISYREFDDWRSAAATTIAGIAAHTGIVTMTVGDEGIAPESALGTQISFTAFGLLGIRPLLGRDFRADDDRPGAPSVVMVGHDVWTRRYGADPGIIGRTIRISNIPSVVIGVMPPGFRFPFNNDLWKPLASAPSLMTERREARVLQVFGRLTDLATMRQAQSEINAIVERVSRDDPGSGATRRLTIDPFAGRLRPRDPNVLLLGATGFLLLIACINVANLVLARAAHRSHEIAIRTSLGASRWRIVRQLLMEHALLASIAALVGLGLSVLGVQWWAASVPDVPWPYWWDWTMDARVYRFLAGISISTALVFGVAPALQVSKASLSGHMKEAGRGTTSGVSVRHWTSVVLTLELASTLMLLAGAGLTIRTFLVLYRVDAVVDTSNGLLGLLRLPPAKYPTADERLAFLSRLRQRLSGISSISSVTTASTMPFIGAAIRSLTVDGRPTPSGDTPPNVSYVVISPNYFESLRVGLLSGRPFTDLDGGAGREVAIVNQRFIAMHFPNEDPIGRRIRLMNPLSPEKPPPWATIVGVSPTIRQQMGQELDPVAYVPYRQDAGPVPWIIARAASNPDGLLALLRAEIRALDPDLALGNVLSLDDTLANTRFANRSLLTAFVVFAAIALLLCVVGLYAVTAYSVRRRTQEIGLRVALGARTGQVVWLFVRRSMLPLAIGLALGVGGVLSVARMMQAFLIQTSATDSVTLLSAAGLVILVTTAASFFPAQRAARIDPVTALRHD